MQAWHVWWHQQREPMNDCRSAFTILTSTPGLLSGAVTLSLVVPRPRSASDNGSSQSVVRRWLGQKTPGFTVGHRTALFSRLDIHKNCGGTVLSTDRQRGCQWNRANVESLLTLNISQSYLHYYPLWKSVLNTGRSWQTLSTTAWFWYVKIAKGRRLHLSSLGL